MKPHILDPYWTTWGAVSSNGAMACKIESLTRKGEYRVALWFQGANRWRISPPIGMNFADQIMTEARKDMHHGRYNMTSTKHMIATYRRQTEKARKIKHKAAMEKRLELRAMENMAGFGMF